MKKTILGLAFLTMASVSFGAAAQNAKNNADCTNTECVAKKCAKGAKGDKKKGDRKAKNSAEKQAARQAALFEGLNLTTEQKGRIEALDGAMKVSRQELKDAAKTARQNGDTTFNMRDQSKQLRSKYVKDLGEILSPDQMITYLENFYVNNGGQKGAKKNIAVRGERKGGKMLGKDSRKVGDRKDMKVRGERKAEKAVANAKL